MIEAEERLIADRIEGVPLPAESLQLIGHESTANRIAESYKSGRMHHAWLLSGPKGIGKATLAFHAARHFLAHPDHRTAGDRFNPQDWPVPLVRQVAQGAHPDLMHLTRPWDEKNKRFKTQLSVDEIRKTQSFYGLTSGAGGWRITIVDAADDMNASAANALLKILEEPPKRSVFFVITHAAGGLLPTIRSRCNTLHMQPLVGTQVRQVMDQLALKDEFKNLDQAIALAEGSVRQALQLASGSVIASYTSFEKLMQGRADGSSGDWIAAHKIADALARKGAEQDHQLFVDLMLGWIGRQVREDAATASPSTLAGWAEVWEKANRSTGLAATFNLDRKQVILTLFRLLFERNAS